MNWGWGWFEYFTKESILNVRLVCLSRQKIVDMVVNVVFEGEYSVEDEVIESEVEEGGSWQHLYSQLLVSPNRITSITLQTLFKPDRPCPDNYLHKPFTVRVTVTGINLKDGTGIEQGLCVQLEAMGPTLTSYKSPRQGSNEISQRKECARDP